MKRICVLLFSQTDEEKVCTRAVRLVVSFVASSEYQAIRFIKSRPKRGQEMPSKLDVAEVAVFSTFFLCLLSSVL